MFAGTSEIGFLAAALDSPTGGLDCSIAPDCIVAAATPTAVANPAKPVMMIWVEVNGIIDLSVFILIIFVGKLALSRPECRGKIGS